MSQNYKNGQTTQTSNVKMARLLWVKGVVNCQNSRDKGPPEDNSARG